jgi:arsenical pump membrane protein
VLVTALAVTAAAAFPDGLAAMRDGTAGSGPVALTTVAAGATALAGVVNNLPALLVGLRGVTAPSWPAWSWILGVSLGPVLSPLGSLANLLWWQALTSAGVPFRLRSWLRVGWRVGFPALATAVATLVVERAVFG